MAGNPQTATTTCTMLMTWLQDLLDCVRAQQAAVARGDLDEARRHADRFDQIRAGLGPDALIPAGRDEPRVAALLRAVVEEHQRLCAGVELLREEVRQRLRHVRRAQPAVRAYRRQVATVAGGRGVAPAAGAASAAPSAAAAGQHGDAVDGGAAVTREGLDRADFGTAVRI